MATVSITIPNDKLNRVLDGFCGQYNYQAQITVDGELVDNPETKAQFVQRKVREFIHETVKSYEASAATKAAKETAIANVNTDITLS